VNKKHLILSIYGYGTLILATGILALVMFWLLYPYKTIVVNAVELKSKSVQQGGLLPIRLEYDRYTTKDSTITRQFKDGIIFTTPTSTGVGGIGHYDRLIEVPVPVNLPPGLYTLETTVSYRVNPIRTVQVVWSTEQFTVTQSTNGAYGLDKE
jgi:ABC-type maltose transport system permease subunit